MSVDLFRVTMSRRAGPALSELFTPDANGRTYVGEGPRVRLFEQAFIGLTGLRAESLSEPHPQHPDWPGFGGVNSCSAALDLALRMCGVGPGDEVVSSPITCTATTGAIVNLGAKVVWADVSSESGNIDPASVARMVGPKTKAVIAVDWGGRSCDYARLREAAFIKLEGVGYRLPIIQDAAHRLYLTDPHGDYVCFSHGPIKHLTGGGYGGAMLVPPEMRTRARLLRWHGLDRLSKQDYRCSQDITESGFRYHLTDDIATVELCNLPLAADAVALARANAAWYTCMLSDVRGVRLLPFDPRCDYWIFTILVDDRDDFSAFLGERGIPTSQVHARNDRHTAFAAATARSDRLAGVDAFDAHQVAIPCGWWVTHDHDLETDTLVPQRIPDRLKVLSAIWQWSAQREWASPQEQQLQER